MNLLIVDLLLVACAGLRGLVALPDLCRLATGPDNGRVYDLNNVHVLAMANPRGAYSGKLEPHIQIEYAIDVLMCLKNLAGQSKSDVYVLDVSANEDDAPERRAENVKEWADAETTGFNIIQKTGIEIVDYSAGDGAIAALKSLGAEWGSLPAPPPARGGTYVVLYCGEGWGRSGFAMGALLLGQLSRTSEQHDCTQKVAVECSCTKKVAVECSGGSGRSGSLEVSQPFKDRILRRLREFDLEQNVLSRVNYVKRDQHESAEVKHFKRATSTDGLSVETCAQVKLLEKHFADSHCTQ